MSDGGVAAPGSKRTRRMVVSTVDYHCAGGPFRIVSGGVRSPRGATMSERRRDAEANLDEVRRLLAMEPRGHSDMDGAFVMGPVDDGADLGVVFFETGGYSTACGHGTIALTTWALESGLVALQEPESRVVLDVPSGRIEALATVSEGKIQSVRFRNVPSFVYAEGVEVSTSIGPLSLDISFGGAFYAAVMTKQFGLTIDAEGLPGLIAVAREIKRGLSATDQPVHPLDPELKGVYGVMFIDEDDAVVPVSQRSVTVFGNGAVDRSPCGSGTSARLALLHSSGRVRPDEWTVQTSIIGSVFRGRIVEEVHVADIPAVVTEIEGRAHLTGFHHFVLESDDEIGPGFSLR